MEDSAQFKALVEDVKKALEAYPELQGKVALAEIPPDVHSMSEKRRCLKWGTNPATGERVCVLWSE